MLDKVICAIKNIEAGFARPRTFEEVLSGYSGDKIIALLQSLSALLTPPTECYLEIGVFQGLTLLANATANPSIACFGIDNFSQFDPAGNNLSVLLKRQRELNVENVELVVDDFEQALKQSI